MIILWITHNKGMMLTMNGTMFYIIIILTLYSYLNGNIGTILKIHPPFYRKLFSFPKNIIINFWGVLTHRNANSNGLSLSGMAVYGVVELTSTLLPCLEELIGA
jgi:hypothetical protein